MKYFFLIAVIAVAVFAYFQQASGDGKKVAVVEQPHTTRPAAAPIVIASSVSYNDRWKAGQNAQTDLKVGPNAQTSFEPFAPSVQATWNQTPGYTIVAGRHTR